MTKTAISPPVDICVTFDVAFTPYFAALLRSIVDHASRDRLYRIHVITDVVSDIQQALLRSIAAEKSNIRMLFVPIAYRGRTSRERFESVALTRLRLAELLPDIDRVLYLDVDTIAAADLAELFDTDLDGRTIGAARDVAAYRMYRAAMPISDPLHRSMAPDFKSYLEDYCGLSPSASFLYFNTGVLIIDLKNWRESQFCKKAEIFLINDRVKYFYGDQDPFNIMFFDNYKEITACWNYFSWDQNYALTPDFPHCTGTPRLYHFAGAKPWADLDATNAERFFAAIARTPYVAPFLVPLALRFRAHQMNVRQSPGPIPPDRVYRAVDLTALRTANRLHHHGRLAQVLDAVFADERRRDVIAA